MAGNMRRYMAATAAGGQVEPMQVDPVAEENENVEEPGQVVVENPSLDLEVYAAQYTGLARLQRLMYIADHCPSLEVEALNMALQHVKNTYNVSLYKKIHLKLAHALCGGSPAPSTAAAGSSGGAAPSAAGDRAADAPWASAASAGGQGAAASSSSPAAPSSSANGGGGAAPLPDAVASTVRGPAASSGASPSADGGGVNGAAAAAAAAPASAVDLRWVEDTQKKAALKLEKLDQDLKNYKSNSIKESIRRGQDDLGEHYLDCGDLTNALKCFSRARDYCTTSRHVVLMCMNVIKVSVYLENWSHVMSYVNKAESTPDEGKNGKELSRGVFTKLKCATGLAELANRKYKNAARAFLQANFDHSLEFPEMLSQNNIAYYGGLCALASFDRQELQKFVISNNLFKQFLELEPGLRDIINAFYSSRYGHCLRLLDEARDNLSLDIYLASHIRPLYTLIRNRGLIQYFSPYLSADMTKMAGAFNTSVERLEDELMALILDGSINARIDSLNKVLYAKDKDQRSAMFERALEMGKEYQRKTRGLIIRAAVLKRHLQVKNPPKDSGKDDAELTLADCGEGNTRKKGKSIVPMDLGIE